MFLLVMSLLIYVVLVFVGFGSFALSFTFRVHGFRRLFRFGLVWVWFGDKKKEKVKVKERKNNKI